MRKRISGSILAAVMAASLLLTACGKSVNTEVPVEPAAQEVTAEAAATQQSQDEAEPAGQSAEAEQISDESGLPMDPSVMKPWINSTIMGMVTEDVNADIKDDFFLNVNHDWLMNAKLRPGYPNEMPIFDAAEIVETRCLDILADKSLTGNDAKRIQDYYELWLDWDTRNKTGIEPIMPFVEKLQAVSSLEDMNKLLVSEDNFKWGTSFAGLGLGLNAEDSSLYQVNIAATPLYLSDSAEYKTLTENGKRTKKATEANYSYMLSRIGMTDDEISKTLEDLLAFETKIAESVYTTLENYDPDTVAKTINPVTLKDLESLSPNYPLVEYLNNYGFGKSKLINLMEPEWLKKLNEVYTEDNLPGIKAYMLCHSIGRYVTSIDEEAFRYYQKIVNEATGTEESKTDEELAYEDARSEFSDCFARLYIEKYLNEEIKQEITQLCQDAIDAYDEMFDTIDWLSEETRKEAKNKLRHMTINAVYPEKWDDDSMYVIKSRADGGTFIEAIVDLRVAGRKDVLRRLNTKIDPDIWLVDILTTNAFYNPQDNSINIIPGFFCDVTYRSDMTIEEKYGALGSVIGHEISHAFDTTGAQFDADGNFKNWWTDEDFAAFTERADKLVSYYDQVVAFDDGTPYQGQMVQGEAIADMAGIKCMLFMAKKIDGFDYDKFFRANAAMWARVGTVEFIESCATTDSHPLHYLRTNVSCAQFDEFIDTYGIKEGDGMYIAPEDRIAVW